jgi:sugar lactone lactonase YvrE
MAVVSSSPSRVSEDVRSGAADQIKLIGLYSADGKYRPITKITANTGGTGVRYNGNRPSDVPGFVDLHPLETVVENYEPPAHSTKTAKGRSAWARFRDNLITAVYGRERVMVTPRDVTTDSKGRVITVDPSGSAVHVLDGEHSFRIQAGPQRRLVQPNAVAVDSEDNIYISDTERGLIVVYDPNGAFLRYLGKLGNESLFHYPTGIAIDRTRDRLYALDTSRHQMFILNLHGEILKRVGRSGGNTTAVDFNYPTEVAVADGTVAVLDDSGSHVHILDLDGNPRGEFPVSIANRHGIVTDMGLGVDQSGNIYVSNISAYDVRIYDRTGKRLLSIGKPGDDLQAFNRPGGVWIDAADHMFVADTLNNRVKVFQLHEPANSDSSRPSSGGTP